VAIYSAGTAYLQVVPSFRGIEKAIADEVEKLGRNTEAAIAKSVPEGMAKAMKAASKDAEAEGEQAGEKWAGAWATAVLRGLKRTLKNVPEVELKADSSAFDKTLAAVREEVKELSEADIKLVDEKEVIASIDRIAKRFARLEEEASSVSDFINIREARAEFDALVKMSKDFAERGAKTGEEFAGKFIEAVNRHLKSALRDLPDVQIRADASDARKELAFLRLQLEELSRLKVGVSIDEAEFMARTRVILARLREISQSDPSVQVRADAAAAAASLTAILKLAERVDDQNPRVKVAVDGIQAFREMADEVGISMTRLGYLISLGASVGTILVPAAAAAAVAIGAIGTAALAAASGVGVVALGLSGVSAAVKALDAAQKDADKSAQALSAAQARVAGAADSVRSAERSLANTRASVGYAAQRAAQQVVDAERSVARAQRDAAEAVRDLVRARDEERRQQEDLALRMQSNALSQRQANLDIADAKRDLDRVLANPRASEEEREQARITYEARVLQLKELTVQQKRMAADQKAQAKAGIDGSDRVRAAQERVRDTNERVAQSQQRLAEAVESQQQQQRQGAYQIQQAQQSLISAQRALEQATVASGTAGGEAMRNLREAMEALSPAGQRFARFLFGLKDELKTLRDSAQEGLLPGLQRGIERLLPYLPAFTRFIGAVGRAVGAMFERTITFLSTDPTWRRFFGFIGSTAVPTLEKWEKIARNVGTGLAALFLALTPFNDDIGDGLVGLTQRFANWATSLESSSGYQKFLDYVARVGPKVVDLIGQLAKFVERVVIAAAPIGEVVLDVFIQLFEWINKIPIDVLTVLIGVLGGVAAAFALVSAATAVVTAGYAALIILAIAAIATEWAILYTKVEPVRNVIDTTLRTIADVVSWAWKYVIKPALNGIGWALRNIVAPAFEWVFGHVIRPMINMGKVLFGVIGAAVQVMAGLFQIWLKIAGAAWSALYNNVIKPIWNKIKPIFELFGTFIQVYVLPKFKEQVAKLGKIWDALVGALKAPVKVIVDVVLNKGILAAYNRIAKFFKVKPDDVKVDLPKGFARGGRITGPGTGTSDQVPIWASAGEHMWTAAEVQAVGGHNAMVGLRRAALNGNLLPGFRHGGAIGDGFGDFLKKAVKKGSDIIGGVTDFFTDPAGTLKKLADNLLKILPDRDHGFFKAITGMPRRALGLLVDKVKGLFRGGQDEGNPTGGEGNTLGGSQGMIRILRGPFPGLPLNSGFRPGARTLSGNVSYHARNRAVDVPPRMDVFEWIRRGFPQSRELIFSPAGARQIHNGGPHFYKGAVRNQHYDHVHWAYDEGGMLPPGLSTAFNGTGAPEAVLTSNQWRDIRTLAAAGARSGNTYNFEFADTTLTAGKLRALQERDAVLAREGRAR
jgi:hypothetical protein